MSLKLTSSPEDLRDRFFQLRTLNDVADLLDIGASSLCYHIYIADSSDEYKVFTIPKKSGGTRTIAAPVSPLKIIQWKLNQVLQAVYVPKASVHGFIPNRNILTNANRHLESRAKRRYVLNIDLANFFPSIVFQRIQGLFEAVPYRLPREVARILALICCYEGKLPQGAPTSPIISNLICAKMDTQLRRLAQANKCIYTRYADDITFSTSLPYFPQALATRDDATQQLRIGDALQQIISNNGFSLNLNKIRLQTRVNRQEITGLTVNKFPNVSRKYVRQMKWSRLFRQQIGSDLDGLSFQC